MEDDKRKSKSSSFSKKKKNNQAKSKSLSKHPSAALRRRKKKAKVVDQRSVEDVHCFTFPFIDFLCGCNNNNGKKDRERIKKISAKHVSQTSKRSQELSLNCVTANKSADDKKEIPIISNDEKDDTNDESNINTTSNDPLPKGLTEPIPLQNLKVNNSMKHILANIKLTSLFGCPNVPKSMSQIKILLDNNPSLKRRLKDILGENLKNENMKTISDLLASEKSGSDASGESTIISSNRDNFKSENKCSIDDTNSSGMVSKRNSKEGGEKRKHMRKSSRYHSSKSTIKNSSYKKKLDNIDNQSMFSKVFSTVFGNSKSNYSKNKSKDSSKSSVKSPKFKTDSRTIPYNEEKTKGMREKYDEWYKNAPNDVRERFRWEDYARVTMYLNDNAVNCSNGDKDTNKLLNRWLKTFSDEMNGNKPNEKTNNLLKYAEHNDSKTSLKCNFDAMKPLKTKETYERDTGMSTRFKSDEMLNYQAKEGGDRIVRLNSLMKELLDRNCNESQIEGKHKGDGDEVHIQKKSQPGCSNWSTNEKKYSDKSQEEESLDQMRMMCASFVEKLTEHKSREITDISKRIPWQNKDFQVFCLPYIENSPFTIFRESVSVSNYSEENGAYGDGKVDLVGRIGNFNTKEKQTFSSHFMGNSGIQSKSIESLNTDLQTKPCENFTESSSSDKNFHVKPEIKHFENKTNDSKLFIPQKKVSFEDDANVNSNTLSDCKEKDIKFKNYQKEFKIENEQFPLSVDQYENLQSLCDSFTSSSYNQKIKLQQDQMSISTRQSMDRETIKYIEEHQSEIIDILKQLVSLSNHNPNFFQQAEEVSNILTVMNSKKECIGIQCKLSEDKSLHSGDRLKIPISIAKNGSIGIKSESYNAGKIMRSECESSEIDSIRLNSSSSDSGVYSKSSTSCRRFTSLPDVLEGAPMVAVPELPAEMSSKEKEDVESKISAGSNASSSLGTSISCQASQAPDTDDLSQISSDLAENISSLLQCKASYFNLNNSNSSSEKSRSSEITLDSSNSNMVRTKIKRLLKILRK